MLLVKKLICLYVLKWQLRLGLPVLSVRADL